MNLPELNHLSQSLILVLSGPSGAGKDFVLTNLKKRPISEGLTFVVTNTTRPKRLGELQDTDYHFVTPAEFQKMIVKNELLEYANVYGYWYGVSKESVRTALAAGQSVIIKVDVQGARAIKELVPQAVLVFLSPPSLSELSERLQKRNTESPDDLARRLKTAEAEMIEMHSFDYAVLSETGRVDRVVSNLEAIITAERHRTRVRKYCI